MKLIVTGSRDWTDSHSIRAALNLFTHYKGVPNTLIHGDCPSGADFLADQIATEGNDSYTTSWIIRRYPAEWNIHGRAAGPIRNEEMVWDHRDADYVLAFPLGESRGTRDCMKVAREAGLTVVNLGDK